MFSKTPTFHPDGLTAKPYSITVDIRNGLPAFSLIGLPDRAVREIRERVRAALLNAGFEFPQRRITIGVTPARPEHHNSPLFDLPIAIGILQASGQISTDDFSEVPAIGELSLDGAVQPVRGGLAIAEAAILAGAPSLIVPKALHAEAALTEDLAIRPITHLSMLADGLPPIATPPDTSTTTPPNQGPRLEDLRGHEAALRILEIAAAGGHSIFFAGAPGCGKTMLARRLPSILPPMTPDEALEVTRIQSIAGNLRVDGLVKHRPFRAPHHTISATGLVGMNSQRVLPGEVTLAHRGVLFLDSLSDFSQRTIDSLSQPITDHSITLGTGSYQQDFPADFQLVVATDPCYCGRPSCRCSPQELDRYCRRIQTLSLRTQLFCNVTRPTTNDIEAGPAANSAEIQQRAVLARTRQTERYAGSSYATNATQPADQIRKTVSLPEATNTQLNTAYRDSKITLLDYDNVLRVARTIADLDDSDTVTENHTTEALTAVLNPLINLDHV